MPNDVQHLAELQHSINAQPSDTASRSVVSLPRVLRGFSAQGETWPIIKHTVDRPVLDIMKWFSKDESKSLSIEEMRKAELDKIRRYDRFILLRVSRCGCRSAIRHMDRVYQVNQPPKLPFSGCDAAECHCVYEGIVDRRTTRSRRYRVERRRAHRANLDRRLNHGRRNSDLLVSYGHF